MTRDRLPSLRLLFDGMSALVNVDRDLTRDEAALMRVQLAGVLAELNEPRSDDPALLEKIEDPSIAQWINECCMVKSHIWTEQWQLRDSWWAWSESRGEARGNARRFYNQLGKQFTQSGRRSNNHHDGIERMAWGYVGIRLKP